MNATALRPTRTNHLQKCKFCLLWVNLDEEGNTYKDGSAAHEECADEQDYLDQNAADFRD